MLQMVGLIVFSVFWVGALVSPGYTAMGEGGGGMQTMLLTDRALLQSLRELVGNEAKQCMCMKFQWCGGGGGGKRHALSCATQLEPAAAVCLQDYFAFMFNCEWSAFNKPGGAYHIYFPEHSEWGTGQGCMSGMTHGICACPA